MDSGCSKNSLAREQRQLKKDGAETTSCKRILVRKGTNFEKDVVEKSEQLNSDKALAVEDPRSSERRIQSAFLWKKPK